MLPHSYSALTDYGWKRSEGHLEVIWEVPENVLKVQARLDFAFSGCKCKTGCTTRRCKCLKQEKSCGPGCQCLNCQNLPKSQPAHTRLLNELEAEERLEEMCAGESELVEDSDKDVELEVDEETEEIMEYVFGSESDDDMS